MEALTMIEQHGSFSIGIELFGSTYRDRAVWKHL